MCFNLHGDPDTNRYTQFSKSAWDNLVTLAITKHWNPAGAVLVSVGLPDETQAERDHYTSLFRLGSCYVDDNPAAVWKVVKEDSAAMTAALAKAISAYDTGVPAVTQHPYFATDTQEHLSEFVDLFKESAFTIRFAEVVIKHMP